MREMKMASGLILFLGFGGLGFGATIVSDDWSDLPWQDKRTQVSLAELREKCSQILKNDQMVKPWVDVVCDERRFEWRECPSTYQLQNDLRIRGAIGMKDWMAYKSQTTSTTVTEDCGTFVRHQVNVKWIKTDAIKCEDLLAKYNTEDDLIAFCADAVKQRTGQDGGIKQDMGPTGDQFTTCPGPNQGKIIQSPDQGKPCEGPNQQQPGQGGQSGGGQQGGGQSGGGQTGGGQQGGQGGQGADTSADG